MPRPSEISIDLDALVHNARLARTLAGSARLLAAVKGDAYGHGMLACGQTLSPLVDALAVAFVEEAITLREHGVEAPILIMEGPFDAEDLAAIKQHEFATVIHSQGQIELLAQEGISPDNSLWLKVDTGMHRLGLSMSEVDPALNRLTAMGVTDITLMTHLAMAESPEAALTVTQLRRWEAIIQSRPLKTSLWNSAGLLGHLAGKSDWVRPGYMLYGGHPGHRFDAAPLKPVMAFTSRIMAVRDIARGESVGYGGHWQAARDSRIATVSVGYADGYPRTATNGTPVWVDGHICPLVGRVSMDMLTVDVTDLPATSPGAPVELWGPRLSVDTVAQHADTIGYELLTRLPARIPRRWVSSS